MVDMKNKRGGKSSNQVIYLQCLTKGKYLVGMHMCFYEKLKGILWLG